MKKISFNDYIPKELSDTESCRLITEEQYKEWKRADEEIDDLTNQLMKVNKLWEQTIKANKMYGRKLDIAIRALEEIAETDWWWRAKQALKEMEEV